MIASLTNKLMLTVRVKRWEENLLTLEARATHVRYPDTVLVEVARITPY